MKLVRIGVLAFWQMKVTKIFAVQLYL